MTTDNRESLSQLLEQDKEQVFASLQADRESGRARQVLEKETDRLMYRAARAADSSSRSRAVQGMLQVVKNTLPLLESVTDTEVWEKSASSASGRKRRVSAAAVASLAAGLFCIVAGLFSQASAGKVVSLGAVLWAAGGCALLALGGYLTGRGRGGMEQAKPEVTYSFLVDPARVWHVLQGIVLTADHSLEEAEEYARLESSSQMGESAGLDKEELAFFSELLENAYARRRKSPDDAALAEQVASIRYYLHSRGVETEDYSEQSAGWFEVLPSGGGNVTIRPAMLHEGALIRKGLATC
jgi:hypothetical protein